MAKLGGEIASTLRDGRKVRVRTARGALDGDPELLRQRTRFLRDQTIESIFLQQDRDALYNHNQPLFDELQEKYGITGWNFFTPDGRMFLRMQEKDNYGDQIDRFTLKKAEATGELASGIEMGKTAYALRVVAPYRQDNQIIGYVELYEEIPHFLTILKDQAGSDVSIVADKKFLNKADWISVTQARGIKNNWDNLKDYLVIGATGDTQSTQECFSGKNVQLVSQGKNIFQTIKNGGKEFVCGGFEIIDASGAQAGALMIVADMSDHAVLANTINHTGTVYLILILGIALLIGIMFSRSISKSIAKLSKSVSLMSHGDLDQRVDIRTGDEIEYLGKEFNKMADDVKKAYRQQEEKVRQRTVELEQAKTGLEASVRERTQELEKAKAGIEAEVKARTDELNDTVETLQQMNNSMINRELKMIELKEKISELEAKLGQKDNPKTSI